MISIIKNDWLRTKNSIARIGIMFVLILAVIILSFVLSNRTAAVATVAVVGEKNEVTIQSKQLNINYVDQKPLKSELVKGTYDAIVSTDGLKGYTIETIKGENFKSQLTDVLEDSINSTDLSSNTKDSLGVTLLSYLLMFLLMASLTNMMLFSEEKEKHLLERIVTAPISFVRILIGHSLFAFLLIFLPTLCFIFGVNVVFQKEFGMSYWQLSLLLLFVCLFATSFSLLIVAIFKEGDKANMFGSLLIIITTMLSGSFFSFEGGNLWLEKIIQVMPQKRFILLFKDIEIGKDLSTVIPNMVYVGLLIVLFYVLAIFKTKRDYKRN